MTPPGQHTESAFESAIESHLVSVAGYVTLPETGYDKVRALFPEQVLNFIKSAQPKEWSYLENIQKAKAEEALLHDLCRALDSENEGCLKVLRHGFKCFGKTFRVAYFAPASGLNPDTVQLYEANRLTITRQLHYSTKNENSLDVVLSLNGIPLVTMELKNPMTGQTWRNAVHQYKNDRDPKEPLFQFRKRTLVHFAVDPDEAYMTTRLSGKGTRFLPFNRGSGTGAGNPENPSGYRTFYLWEQVLERGSFLDILARFIHLETKDKKVGGKKVASHTMIFPRFHQLDCVRRLVGAARQDGAGHNYLIQHSAGSGKSNSIAWLAHRLQSLYDVFDNKVFDSIVVVTDRKVLDQQLQNTIYQFEHKQGVVVQITNDSAKSTQLANALEHASPIIITTLQTFPFVTEKIGTLPDRRYAVIIDEAHSSQGGQSSTELKQILGGTALAQAAAEQAKEEELTDHEETVLKTMMARGRQPNISFFAFTATPKYKTLEVFGTLDADGKPYPFHLYSMRQAIEEGFILDVLQHYTTYKTYYGLVKSIEDDPEVDKKKAARALARFISLHPHNISQKAEEIVEHFRMFTRHKIGGKAKAMVVTGSRLHAVRYKQALDKYISNKGYTDTKTLVAFSGTLSDPDVPGMDYTEVSMNLGIKESELPERFDSGEYQVLIVAEKYQTGFDQPLLHTMYVDKKLSGIQAVQTLSRLNRIHPGKEDTFVLDFVNEGQDIFLAFQPYYEVTTVGNRAEASQLYDLQAKLDGYQVYYKPEVEEFARVFYKPKAKQSARDHERMNAILDPAVGRFSELDDEARDEFRKTLVAYRNLFAFLSQIIPFYDTDLEKLYSYGRFLLNKLPKGQTGPAIKLDDDVALKWYRLQKISEGAISLVKDETGEINGPTSVGMGGQDEEQVHLSTLIEIFNERFQTDFGPGDELFVESIKADAVANPDLRQAATVNTMEGFAFKFKETLKDLFIDRMEQNEDITAKFFNDPEFNAAMNQYLMTKVYNEIRESGAAAL